MARSTAMQADPIPHMPELLFHVPACWRAIRDAQTEVDPFGRSFGALGEARASLEALAYHCTGQSGILVLVDDDGLRVVVTFRDPIVVDVSPLWPGEPF